MKMDYTEFGFGLFEEDIKQVAQRFNLDLTNLQVEFFSPGRQAILLETVGAREFRVHLSLEEGRIIAVKQTGGPLEPGASDVFAKYRSFMK
ncbi:hypothetical protein HUU05_03530 [candidate division KSB1 bacterium]|nr:hypothetical protein [candidate division KSB1 bacterium]